MICTVEVHGFFLELLTPGGLFPTNTSTLSELRVQPYDLGTNTKKTDITEKQE